MKKYLMTGMAAIAFCAAFTSCSKDENLYDPKAIEEMETAQVYEAYNQAFIATFGQVHPNQDWGFGSRAGTRGENANGNEWAATYKVPPVLTDDQIDIVRQYFQQVQGRTYSDPGWSKYFMQQVYKGHTNAGEGSGSKSPEVYNSVANTGIIGSDHMNHLAAVFPDGTIDHINNFNNGDCGTYGNVLDNGQPINGGTTHPDKIMLMENSTTNLFCYHNSDGSLSHANYTTLVGWETIRTWARGKGIYKEDVLNDGWNRSFMGFDFEQRVGPDCYAKENGAEKNMVISGEYYINGVKQTDYVYQYNNAPVKVLSSNTNLYCGNLRTVNDSQLYSEERDANNNNAYLGKKLNTDFIDGLLRDGYLPVDTKQLREWVKVGGCADGYYSDWIVTLTEAKPIDNPDPTAVRIMAEDLNAEAKKTESDIEDSDWDFNDVVFDVTFNEDGSQATVQLVAAGGVLPLRIYDGNGTYYEVHERFGQSRNSSTGWYPMINTGGIAQVSGATAQPFTVYNPGVNGQDIKIEVNKFSKNADGTPGTDHWYELTADKGKPAAKFAVKTSVQPLRERTHIDYQSGGAFSRAVQDGTWNWIWW